LVFLHPQPFYSLPSAHSQSFGNLQPIPPSSLLLAVPKRVVYTAKVSSYSSSLPHTRFGLASSSSYCSFFLVRTACCMNKCNKFKLFYFIFSTVFSFCTAITVQGYFRPLGLQNVECPRNSKPSTREGGKVVNPTYRPTLPPGNIAGINFC